jgi:hypothetical protein
MHKMLYTNQWQKVENIYAGATEELTPEQRRYFSISSRTNDQINLNFGDGVFSSIPVGTFRTYVRSSNGLNYIINPDEMQNVTLSIGYVVKDRKK